MSVPVSTGIPTCAAIKKGQTRMSVPHKNLCSIRYLVAVALARAVKRDL
jgi:hypothetical protein